MKLTFDEAKHEYTLNGQRVPSVTQILQALDFYPAYPDNGCRERGQAVHKCCELYDKGQLLVGEGGGYPGTDRRLWGYIDGWRKFRRDMAQWRWDAIETPVAHAGLRYAGTKDRSGVDERSGMRIYADLKSGAPAECTKWQLAAYALADGADREATRFYSIEACADGDYVLTQYDNVSTLMDEWVVIAKFFWLKHGKQFLKNGRQK